MKVQMHDVDSSNLDSAGWANDTLVIKFRNGGVYTYESVDKSTFDELLSAASAGKFFHTNIRKAFSYRRVGNFLETDDGIQLDA